MVNVCITITVYVKMDLMGQTCNGTSSIESHVCNGSCIDQNVCNCHNHYNSPYCDEFSCFGISNHNSTTCSSHGSCIAHNKMLL
mmetsp:Transcript_3710/g.5487  ORF Transcript_3710/g.5487 Transcript_3710/m.5487 type:complete len:84 (+) Transcript_3710:255-506(+)